MEKFNKKEKREKLFITFTDLYEKKQAWILEKLEDNIDVYLVCRSGQPIKMSLPEIG